MLEGDLCMYCSQCRRQLYYKDLKSQGWCDTCEDVVGVSECNVSYWLVMAVVAMLWSIPLGG